MKFWMISTSFCKHVSDITKSERTIHSLAMSWKGSNFDKIFAKSHLLCGPPNPPYAGTIFLQSFQKALQTLVYLFGFHLVSQYWPERYWSTNQFTTLYIQDPVFSHPSMRSSIIMRWITEGFGLETGARVWGTSGDMTLGSGTSHWRYVVKIKKMSVEWERYE
jgi:hypothetical protein